METARSATPPAIVTLGSNVKRRTGSVFENGIPILDTTIAESHKSRPISWGTPHSAILLSRISHVKRDSHEHTHTIQRGLYKKFAYQISVKPSGHGGGRRASGMLSKAATQIRLEGVLVRVLRKVLLVHDIRSRSAGWTRCNTYERISRHTVGDMNGSVDHLVQDIQR